MSGMSIHLRTMHQADLDVLTGGDSEFDDWGRPSAPRQRVADHDLAADGGLTIADADTSEALGSVSWRWVQWGPNVESRNPMIGIWLRSGSRGRGIGTAAQQLLAEHIFERTSANRIEAHTDVENVAEQRALTKVGFAREGRVRAAQWRRGSYHDSFLFSLLRSEWSERIRSAEHDGGTDR